MVEAALTTNIRHLLRAPYVRHCARHTWAHFIPSTTQQGNGIILIPILWTKKSWHKEASLPDAKLLVNGRACMEPRVVWCRCLHSPPCATLPPREATFVRASGSSLSISSLPWTWQLLLEVQVLLEEGNSVCVLPQGHPGQSEKGNTTEPRDPIPGAPLQLD